MGSERSVSKRRNVYADHGGQDAGKYTSKYVEQRMNTSPV